MGALMAVRPLGGPRHMRTPTARQREVTWTFPGTDSRLVIDVDFDDYGVPHINEVLDANRQSFPFDEIWYQGKPLEDVLIEYICNTPVEELEPA